MIMPPISVIRGMKTDSLNFVMESLCKITDCLPQILSHALGLKFSSAT